MARFGMRVAGLFGLSGLLLLLFGLVAASADLEDGPKTAAVSSASAAAAARPRPRTRPSSSSSGSTSSGLKMQLTANPRTKDHRNGKSEYILRPSFLPNLKSDVDVLV